MVGAHEGEVIGSAPVCASPATGQRSRRPGFPTSGELLVDSGPWHRANGAEAMRMLLARDVPFDAVFALNDELALGALRVLREHGIDVPGEVAIIGFDDVDEGRYSLPSLSTVDPGRREIARLAVEVLMDRIAGVETGPPRELRSRFPCRGAGVDRRTGHGLNPIACRGLTSGGVASHYAFTTL